MLNFDHSTVKHSTHNIQNYCHQWLSNSFRVQQIRFRLTVLHQIYLAGLRGRTSKGEKKGEGERKESEGYKKGNPPPLKQIPGSIPRVNDNKLKAGSHLKLVQLLDTTHLLHVNNNNNNNKHICIAP